MSSRMVREPELNTISIRRSKTLDVEVPIWNQGDTTKPPKDPNSSPLGRLYDDVAAAMDSVPCFHTKCQLPSLHCGAQAS